MSKRGSPLAMGVPSPAHFALELGAVSTRRLLTKQTGCSQRVTDSPACLAGMPTRWLPDSIFSEHDWHFERAVGATHTVGRVNCSADMVTIQARQWCWLNTTLQTRTHNDGNGFGPIRRALLAKELLFKELEAPRSSKYPGIYG